MASNGSSPPATYDDHDFPEALREQYNLELLSDVSSIVNDDDNAAMLADIRNGKKRKASVKQEKGKKKRAKSYSEKEDLLCCKAYMNASENGLVGKDRKKADFENAIKAAFDLLVEREKKLEEQEYKRFLQLNPDSDEDVVATAVKNVWPDRSGGRSHIHEGARSLLRPLLQMQAWLP